MTVIETRIENQRIRRRLVLFTFFAGYAFGLAMEKAFILLNWPDHTVSPAVVSALVGVGFSIAAGYYYDNEEIVPAEEAAP